MKDAEDVPVNDSFGTETPLISRTKLNEGSGPVTPDLTEACQDDVVRARDLIVRFGWNAMSYQILNPGIRLWFTHDQNAVVGYVDAYGYRVVAGEPVCERSLLPDVVARFRSETIAARKRICYFGAEEHLIRIMSDFGQVTKLLLGSQPVWDPANWRSRIVSKASLRAQLHRARNKGVAVREWDSVRATGNHELRRCLREWLGNRGLPAMHFLVEPETLARIYDRRVFVAERDGANVGFIVASPVPLRRGWLIEQIIRGLTAPNGTAELMLDTAMNALGGLGGRIRHARPFASFDQVRNPAGPASAMDRSHAVGRACSGVEIL